MVSTVLPCLCLLALTGMATGMVAPGYVKSVTVRSPDDLVDAVQVTAVYRKISLGGSDGGSNEVRETVTLTGPSQFHLFPVITQNMGTWTAVMPIVSIEGKFLSAPSAANGDDSGSAAARQFQISPSDFARGIQNNVQFTLHNEPSFIRLMRAE